MIGACSRLNDVTLGPTLKELVNEPAARDSLLRLTDSHGYCVSRGGLGPGSVARLRREIADVIEGTSSGWRPLDRGAPDFYWVNNNDTRSTIKAAFLQVNFFPWNPCGARVIRVLADVFAVRNMLLGRPPDEYLSVDAGSRFTVRAAAQFYPSGTGWMEEHRDPKGEHQTVLATIVMSRIGVDYREGGVYIRDGQNDRLFPEAETLPGDIVWFNPSVLHGVAPVDPGTSTQSDPFSQRWGRWMILCATNGLASSPHPPRAESARY